MPRLEIPARDGFPLAATLYEVRDGPVASADDPPAVVVNSATAVKRRFYRRFAEFLADHGFTTVTYDYRGVGGSRPESLRGFEATMWDWGALDMAGVLDWVDSELAPSRLVVVGHSVGGQLVGMLDNSELVDALVTTSAQSGYWRLQGGVQQPLVGLYVHLVFPMLTPLVGYLPWSAFGPGEDLPAGVALEWARWCRSPNYLFDDDALPLERFADFDAPILAYSFADDDWGTRRSVDFLMSRYENAPLTRRHVAPEEIDTDSIGHVGFYRESGRRLWEEVVRWVRDQASSPRASRTSSRSDS